jgi:hypothetical protein
MNFRFVFGTNGVAGCRDSECKKKKTRTSASDSYESANIRFAVFGTSGGAGCTGTEMSKTDSYECGRLVRVGKNPYKCDSYK